MQIKRIFKYPLDLQGVLTTNLISGETYEINAANMPIVVAREGDFYGDTLVIRDGSSGKLLVKEVDYVPTCYDIEASEKAAGRACYAAFQFLKPQSAPAKIIVEYRLIGGEYVNRVAPLIDAMINVLADKRQAEWNNILNKPSEFPPKLHNHYLSEITDWGALITAIRDNTEVLLKLLTNVETRLLRLIMNLDMDNTIEHRNMLSIITDLSNKYGNLDKDVTDLKDKISKPLETFNMFALKTTKVNNKPLASDIWLNAGDVDAVSATHGGVFKNSFIDDKTNYGRMSNSQCITITNKDQIDNFIPGSMIPVYKHSWNDRFLPMSPGVGTLIKFPTHEGNHRIGYTVLLYGWDSSSWHGFADNHNNIRWTKIVTGEIPDPIPSGTLLHYVGLQPPAGYFIPMGQPYDKGSNPNLAKLLPNGILPDLRGQFLRTFDHGSGRDPGRGWLSWQEDTIRNIYGEVFPISETFGSNGGTGTGPFRAFPKWASGTPRKVDWSEAGGFSFDVSRVMPTSHENRPVNVAVNIILRGG